jgi:hypothetical protein
VKLVDKIKDLAAALAEPWIGQTTLLGSVSRNSTMGSPVVFFAEEM